MRQLFGGQGLVVTGAEPGPANDSVMVTVETLGSAHPQNGELTVAYHVVQPGVESRYI
jgi:hypothetical protein